MTCGLEDLAQDVLRDARIKAANVERTLIRLGRYSAGEGTSAGRGKDRVLVNRRHGRCDCRRDGVRVGRDVQRRRGHVRRVPLAILVVIEARGAGIGLRRWWVWQLGTSGRRA